MVGKGRFWEEKWKLFGSRALDVWALSQQVAWWLEKGQAQDATPGVPERSILTRPRGYGGSEKNPPMRA